MDNFGPKVSGIGTHRLGVFKETPDTVNDKDTLQDLEKNI